MEQLALGSLDAAGEILRRWFRGAQAGSSTIPAGMTRALMSGRRFVSISPEAWFVEVRALGFSLSNLRKPLASIHKLRLSHLGSLASEAANSTSFPGHSHPKPCSKHGQAGASQRRGFRDLAA